MRWVLVLLAASLVQPVVAQEAPRKKPAAKKQAAHKNPRAAPTPEQIRKFNELERKRKKD